MKPGKQFFIIQVNKAAQKQKQEQTEFGLYIAPKFVDMKYNLQHGTIIAIGTFAQRDFPGALPGDTLVFKHIVESQKWRVIDTLYNEETQTHDQLLLVDITSGTEVYGVLQSSGNWIINKNYVFLKTDYKLIIKSEFSKLLNVVDPEVFLSDTYVLEKIAVLKNDLESMKESAESTRNSDDFEAQYSAMQKIADQQAQLGKFMHSKRFCMGEVTLVNESVSKETGIMPACKVIVDHKLLYDLPLERLGLHFKIAHTKYITAYQA